MVSLATQFLKVLTGKRLKVTLKTTSYTGVIERISQKPSRILVLSQVCRSDGSEMPGSKLFLGHEIVAIEDAATCKENAPDCSLETHQDTTKLQPCMNAIKLDDETKDMDIVVVADFYENFAPAVMHIKKQQVIGVGVDGVEVFRHGRLCWLQIATQNTVYLFDILLLGARAFKNGLSMILENQHILKVIHDCRAISGCLQTQFGVKLTNVFDTQVADVMCFYTETGGFLPERVRSLQNVVMVHLKVPSSQISSLKMKSKLTKDDNEIWKKRPCSIPLLQLMALSVIHLQPLRLVLMDAIMADYLTLVDSYLNSNCYMPDELAHVTMESVLELPAELKQLERMRRARREWAADHYRLTEQGLLAPVSRPESGPKTSPASPKTSPKTSPASPKTSPKTSPASPKTSPASPKTLPASQVQAESLSQVAVDSAFSDPQWIEDMQAPPSQEVMLLASLPSLSKA